MYSNKQTIISKGIKMDVNGFFPGVASCATRQELRQFKDSSNPEDYDVLDHQCPQTSIISDTEARAITNMQLLQSLGVQFKKTKLQNGYKRIDLIRCNGSQDFIILDAQDKKIQRVSEIGENTIGSVTLYQEDGETPLCRYFNLKRLDNPTEYKAEKALLSEPDNIDRIDFDCIVTVPEYK